MILPFPRWAACLAALAMLTVGMAGLVTNAPRPPEIASQTPLAASSEQPAPVPVPDEVPVEVPESPAPVRVLTYAEWRASEPVRIVTEAEARAALVDAGMAPHEASRLAHASANCEAPVFDRDGTSIGIDTQARGDQGRAVGPFQIRADIHPNLASRYDLENLAEAARAAVAIRDAAGGLAPWSCIP